MDLEMNEGTQRSVRVARIGKPHGIRGEVTVQIFTDSPERRFASGSVLRLVSADGTYPAYKELTVENARWNKRILLLKFEEFSDRNTAETLRDFLLYASLDDSVDEDDAWYAQDLLGMTVHEASLEYPEIGTVTNLKTGPAQDLLEITLSNGREVLLPFVEEIVPVIDESRNAVVITPPPGLLELN